MRYLVFLLILPLMASCSDFDWGTGTIRVEEVVDGVETVMEIPDVEDLDIYFLTTGAPSSRIFSVRCLSIWGNSFLLVAVALVFL